MKLTKALYSPIFYNRLKNYSWTRWRRQRLIDDGIEEILKEKGIRVVDANEFVKDDSPLTLNIDALPDPPPLYPQPQAFDETHPDWHAIPGKRFDHTCFPADGVPQAQMFTKSVQIKHGLPESLLQLASSSKLNDQAALVENAIRQAMLYDTVIEKLPKLRDLDIPSFSFPRKYGIPPARANERMLGNMIRVCEREFPEFAREKVVYGQNEFHANLIRHNNFVQFKLQPIATILSRQMLKPVTTTEDTRTKKVPDIYPFNSLANFEKEHIYKEEDLLIFGEQTPFPYVETNFFSHHIPGSHTHIYPRWNDDRFSGTTILYSFATALLMARRKFGNDVKILPEPVTSQTVHFTGKEFEFAVFQLNTLDLEDESPDSIKNIVWLTGKMNLFESCEYTYGKGELKGYNPEVFKHLLAFYANKG